MRNEKRGGTYRELERELIEESIDRFLANSREQNLVIDSYEEDPHINASKAEMNAVGFSMEEGQYVYVPK